MKRVSPVLFLGILSIWASCWTYRATTTMIECEKRHIIASPPVSSLALHKDELSTRNRKAVQKHYNFTVAICTIGKDVENYMEEWLDLSLIHI